MGFGEELQRTDEDRVAEIVKTVFANSASSEGFMADELRHANQFPLLRGLAKGINELTPRMLHAGYTPEQIEAMLIGVSIARISISVYASSESPEHL